MKLYHSLFRALKSWIMIAIFFMLIIGLIWLFVYKVTDFVHTVPVQSIEIINASPLVKERIFDSIQALRNYPVLAIKLTKLQEIIKQMPWVADVIVHRKLTGSLMIKVLEINPYFIWLNDDGMYRIINSEKEVVKNTKPFSVDDFIIIEKGQNALDNSDIIRFIIYYDPQLLKQIYKLVFNGYRWDIHLRNGIIIKLPEENLDIAYKNFVELNKQHNILDKHIKYVDITTENKLFIKQKKV